MLSASRDFTLKRCLIRSSLVCLAVVLGEVLPRFDVVMGVIGGTLTGPLIFILPPLFHTRIIKLEAEFDRLQPPVFEADLSTTLVAYGSMSYEKYRDPEASSHWRSGWRQIRRYMRMLYSDCFLSLIVVGFGLTATFASTFYSILTLKDVMLWGSCIGNITSNLEL